MYNNTFYLSVENGDWVRLKKSRYLATSEDFKKVVHRLFVWNIAERAATEVKKKKSIYLKYSTFQIKSFTEFEVYRDVREVSLLKFTDLFWFLSYFDILSLIKGKVFLV